MGKTLLYRLFKVGRIPKTLRETLESERIIAMDEGIGGWIISKNYKAPGRRSWYRAAGFTGFIVVTGKRVIAHAYWRRVLNIPFDNPALSQVKITLVNDHRIEFAFDPAVFNPKTSGDVTLRFNTDEARTIYQAILARTPVER